MTCSHCAQRGESGLRKVDGVSSAYVNLVDKHAHINYDARQLLPDFDKSAQLPAGEMVAVECVPEKAGEYELACQRGMFREKFIVEQRGLAPGARI